MSLDRVDSLGESACNVPDNYRSTSSDGTDPTGFRLRGAITCGREARTKLCYFFCTINTVSAIFYNYYSEGGQKGAGKRK